MLEKNELNQLNKEIRSQRKYQFIIDHSKGLFSISIFFLGFLAGMLGNVISDSNIKTLPDIYMRTFDIQNRPINIINWIILVTSLSCIVIALNSPRFARKLQKKRIHDSLWAKRYALLADESLNTIPGRTIVEKAITLEICPDIKEGWHPNDIELVHIDSRFSMPHEYKDDYEKYISNEYKNDYGDEGLTVMLSKYPTPTSEDNYTLRLDTKVSKYCFFQFFRNKIYSDPNIKLSTLTDIIKKFNNKGNIEFAHNLSLQLVVITKDFDNSDNVNDKRVLLTHRSKVGIYNDLWSCSVEENFKPKNKTDLGDNPGCEGAIVRWIERTLKEELKLSNEGELIYSTDNMRILSVFFEGDAINIALSGIVTLEINNQRLSEILSVVKNNEWDDFKLVTYDELARELVNPTRNYHPTSRYRMLMALQHEYGLHQFAKKYIELSKNSAS